MPDDRRVTLYHAPHARSTGVLILLEELGAPYDLNVLNLKKGEQREPAYLAINPMGKVPVLRHGDAIVTEQVAIYLYLADLFPESGLTPAIGDPRRGPYLRWMAFYAACFEPAVVDRAAKREPLPQTMSPYGDYDTVLSIVVGQLAKGPYFLGERFSVADILWGTALAWTIMFDLVPKRPEITDYLNRVGSRPAALRVQAKDAELAAAQQPKG